MKNQGILLAAALLASVTATQAVGVTLRDFQIIGNASVVDDVITVSAGPGAGSFTDWTIKDRTIPEPLIDPSHLHYAQPVDVSVFRAVMTFDVAGTFSYDVFYNNPDSKLAYGHASIAFTIPGHNGLVASAGTSHGGFSHRPQLSVQRPGDYYFTITALDVDPTADFTITVSNLDFTPNPPREFPDGGATAALLGLGCVGLLAIRRHVTTS